VVTHGSRAACESLLLGTLVAASTSGPYLTVGMISYGPISGPVDVARCRVDVHGEIHSSQLAFTIEDATDNNGNPLEPPPTVVLRAAID